MTTDSFQQFIADYDLYSFDGLIEITLSDGNSHRAVWLTTLAELKPAVDGSFAGLPEAEIFYLFDKKEYLTIHTEQIESVKCVKEDYLK